MTDHDTDRLLTRRSMVRIGAHAAWVVPAVTVVAAAPAMAASGPAALSVLLTPTYNAVAGTVTLSVCTISNANTQATTALTISIILDSVGVGAGEFGSTTTVPTGFALTTDEKDAAGGVIFTFTADAAHQIAGSGSLNFNPVITLKSNGPTEVTVEAIPGPVGTSGVGGPTPAA